MNATEIAALPTPRTDALRMWGPLDDRITTLQDHARRLERENAAMRETMDRIARYPIEHDDEIGISGVRAITRKTLAAIKEYQGG